MVYKKFLFFYLMILPVFLSAQITDDKKFGITLNVNSPGEFTSNGLGNYNYGKSLNGGIAKFNNYALGANVTYYLSGELGLRLKVATTKWHVTEYRDTRHQQPDIPPSPRIDDVTFNSSDLSFALGLFYQYRIEKFSIEGGLDVDYINHAKGVYTDFVTQYDPAGYKIKNVETIPNGNSYGIGGFFGFNFFPIDYLSIGIEFSSALLKTKIGNTVSLKSTVLSGSSQPQDDTYEDSIDRLQFSSIKSSLNISFWF